MFGTGVAEMFGRLGSPAGWEEGQAGVGALTFAGVNRRAGFRERGAGGGEVMPE